MIHGYKILTEDWCSPIQDKKQKNPLLLPGEKLPKKLPEIPCDTSNEECSFGWNFTDDLSKAVNITQGICGRYGLHRLLKVRTNSDIITVKDKIRSSNLQLYSNINIEDIHNWHKTYNLDSELADKELYKWLTVKRNKEDDSKIISALNKTLYRIKGFTVERGDNNNYNNYYYNYYYYHNYYYHNYNNYNYNYNNYYYNYYNYYYNYYYNNYYYYYTLEAVLTVLYKPEDLKFSSALRTAYSYGMRQLRFIDNKLIYFTKSQLKELK